MCGVAGYLARASRAAPDAPATLRIMEALRHRGPDASGLWQRGPCALGHRRLSIIDLRAEANQPMTNEDGSIAIAVNGEIYNFAELRRELEGAGHVFRSRSDSEVIVHGYERWGDDIVARLDGMFALLLYDARRARMLAARDRSGKKPLYWRELRGGVAFASEVGALVRAFPDERPELDLGAIDEFLTLQYVLAPRTVYRGTWRLPAAHYAVFEPGGSPRLTRYWAKPRDAAPLSGSSAELAAELLGRLRAAVKKRLVADVPLGAFLSGGIDSSLVVALVAQESGRAVKTFSIGFPHAGDSELGYARLVARRFATDHHEEIVTPEMTSVLVETVRHHGEPFADSSAVATYYLAKMTKDHVTVALSGDGSDECFGGYKRYATARIGHLHDALPAPGQRALRAVLGRALGAVRPSLAALGHELALGEAARYLRLVGQFSAEEKRGLYLAPMRDASSDSAERRFAELLAGSGASSPIGRLCDLDFETYLEGDINAKVDIASMAHALEVRCPMLDTAVVELAARLPGRMLLRTRGKYLLRRAARGILPARIRHRVKRGFALPLERWMRRDLRTLTHDVLLGPRFRERGLFDAKYVADLVAAMERGRGNADRVWTLLVLELWMRELVDRA